MVDYLLTLGISDVCHGWPGLGPYGATQVAHMALGVSAALLPFFGRRAVDAGLVGLGIWVGKEVFSDIAGCGFSLPVIFDSTADLTCAALGYAVARLAVCAKQA